MTIRRSGRASSPLPGYAREASGGLVLGPPALPRSPKELDRPRREAMTAIKPQDPVRLLAPGPDDKALNACCSGHLNEPVEQGSTNLPAALFPAHIEILDLDIWLLRRDDLDRGAALDRAVDIADQPALMLCHEEVGREAIQDGAEHLPAHRVEVAKGDLFLLPLSLKVEHRIKVLGSTRANLHLSHDSASPPGRVAQCASSQPRACALRTTEKH